MHFIPLFTKLRLKKTLRTPQSEPNLVVVNYLKGLSFLPHSDESIYTYSRDFKHGLCKGISCSHRCPHLVWCSGKAICSVSVTAFMALC